MEKNCYFHKQIKILAEKEGKTIQQIEKELGYPRSSLNNYRYGKIPSGVRLIEVANYFNVTPSYLLGMREFHPSPELYFDSLSYGEKQILYELCKRQFE